MEKPKTKQHLLRDLVIVLIVALLAAFFIWRYFDFRIEKLRYQSTALVKYENTCPSFSMALNMEIPDNIIAK